MEKSARTTPNNVRNKRAMFEGNVSGESSPKATRTPRKDTVREGARGRNKSAPPVNRRRDSEYNPVYNQTDILKEYGPSAVWLLTGGYKNSGKNAKEDNSNGVKNITEDNMNKKIGKITTETFKLNATPTGVSVSPTEAPNYKNGGRLINHNITQTTGNYKSNSNFSDTNSVPPLPKSPPPSSPTFPNLPLSPPPLPPRLTGHISPPTSLLPCFPSPPISPVTLPMHFKTLSGHISPPTSLSPSFPSPPISPVTLPMLSKTLSLPFKIESPEKFTTERTERRSRAYRSSRSDGRTQQNEEIDGNLSKDKQSVMQHLRNIFGEKVDPLPIQPLKQRSKSVTRDSGAKQHAKTFATDLSKETYLFSRNPSGRHQIAPLEGSQKFEKVFSTQDNPQVHRSQIIIELDAHDQPREANKAARKTSYPVKNKTRPQIDQCKENFTTTQPRNEARNVQERSIPITIQQSTRNDDKLSQFPLADCTKQQSGLLHTNRPSTTVPFLPTNHQAPLHTHTVHQYLIDSKQQQQSLGLKRSTMDHNKGVHTVQLGTQEKMRSTDNARKPEVQGKLIKSDKGPSECLIKCALCRNRQMS